ncbi:MAG: sugar phosphate isomerase/epimerase [Ginsengibacter sp.]
MNPSRRSFIKNTGLVLATATFLPNEIFAGITKTSLTSIQLYSVREDMKKDPVGTLKALASYGYKNVEHANYVNRKFYGYTPTEFKKILDDLGLRMPSGHTVMSAKHWDTNKNDFTDDWKYTVEDAKVVGQKYVISPWLDESLRKNYDDLLRFLDLFNKSGQLCKSQGLKFGYHNHDFEFKYSLNDMKIYDIILKNTDPSLVIQQLDFGNMYGAGGRAIEVISKHPGRFESVHVKDEIKSSSKGEMNDGYESTVLGTGLIPIKKVLDYAKAKGGTTLFVIEQESYQNRTPLESAKEDLKVMRKYGY